MTYLGGVSEPALACRRRRSGPAPTPGGGGRDAGEHLEAVSGGEPGAPPEGAQPPALHAARVALDDAEDIAAAEGELVRRLGDVVVQRLRQLHLERGRPGQRGAAGRGGGGGVGGGSSG